MSNIVDFTLNKLAARPDGTESVSHLIGELRGLMPGSRKCFGPFPHFPAGHGAAMEEFERLGFTVTRRGANRGTWWVGV